MYQYFLHNFKHKRICFSEIHCWIAPLNRCLWNEFYFWKLPISIFLINISYLLLYFKNYCQDFIFSLHDFYWHVLIVPISMWILAIMILHTIIWNYWLSKILNFWKWFLISKIFTINVVFYSIEIQYKSNCSSISV